MGNRGDLAAARRSYYSRSSKNLEFLMRSRYEWMQPYIDAGRDVGVELGCGIGVGRDFVRARSLALTDLAHGEWLDFPGVDATRTPFGANEFDFVIVQNVIHHVAQPMQLFREAGRILKPGGRLLVRDVRCSLMTRLQLRLTRVEGYSFDAPVFDEDAVLSDPANAWEANNAIPDLLFRDHDHFHQRVPEFQIVHEHMDECLVLLASGGVTHKTLAIPLPEWGLRTVHALDRTITRWFPTAFAMQRSLVLERR